MLLSKVTSRISRTQWIILVVFALAFVHELLVFEQPTAWVVTHHQLLNPQYFYLYFPFLFDPIGLVGIYKILRFKKIGFTLFSLGFASTTMLDFLLGKTLLIRFAFFGANILLFLLFYFSTKSIREKSS